MKSFSFVAVDFKQNKTTVHYSGVYSGTLPEKGETVVLYDIENKEVPVKITAVKEGGSTPVAGREKPAEISIEWKEGMDPSAFDVLKNQRPENEKKKEEAPEQQSDQEQPEQDRQKTIVQDLSRSVNNRRLEALIWKYMNDRDVDTLGAISMYLMFSAKFFIIAKPGQKRDYHAFPTLESGNRHRFYPVFTNLSEINRKPVMKGSYIAKIGFDGIIDLLHDDKFANGIIINPWTADLKFRRGDLATLKKTKQQIESD